MEPRRFSELMEHLLLENNTHVCHDPTIHVHHEMKHRTL
jgi:hypothetical protein